MIQEREEGGSTAGFSTASRKLLPLGASPALPLLPTLTILAHPDCERVGDRVQLGELVRGQTAFLSRREPRFSTPGARHGAPLEDPFLSRKPLRLVPLREGGYLLERESSRTGLLVDGVEVKDHCHVTATTLEEGVVLELAQRVVLLLHASLPDSVTAHERYGLVGESDAMAQVRAAIRAVADLEVPVLLRGETGTGKELIARALHEQSRRSHGPFVSVNLGALVPTLAAAELFGARRGAFTGAVQDQPGYFSQARGGTLFLDEVGEAPIEVQVMLLRALETHEIVPVGSQQPQRVDVRILAATDADFERLVTDGSFRAPLFHRLATYVLPVPPLRARRDDIGRLLVHFLRTEQARLGTPLPTGEAAAPWLPATLVARLARYSWPGNVRQLRNFARQLVIDSRGQTTLGVDSLGLLTGWSEGLPHPPDPPSVGETWVGTAATSSRGRHGRKPAEISDEELFAALQAHDFEFKAAARALGIPRTSLFSRIARSSLLRTAANITPEEVRAVFARLAGDEPAMARELRISLRALRQRLKDLGLRT